MNTMQKAGPLALSGLPTAALIRLLFEDKAPQRLSSCDDFVICSDQLQRRLEVARELLMRDAREKMQTGPALSNPNAALEWLRWHFKDRDREAFVVMALNSQHHLIEVTELFQGTTSAVIVYPREVVRFALIHNATVLIIAHNHPQGLTEPSKNDECLTYKLRDALAAVDVKLLDHLIVAGSGIFSMAEHKHLQ